MSRIRCTRRLIPSFNQQLESLEPRRLLSAGPITIGVDTSKPVIELDENDCVLADKGAPLRLLRAQETELPRAVALGFTDAQNDYRRAAATSRRLVGASSRLTQNDLTIVASGVAAERRAEIWLQDLWAGRLPGSTLATAW